MNNRIILFKNICFAQNLSLSQAAEALEKAEASGAARYYSFYITSSDGNDSWELCGDLSDLQQTFLQNPEDFLIELQG